MRRTGLQLVTSATAEPIRLDEVKTHQRLEVGYTAEDDYLESLISAARSKVEDHTNLKLMPQTWKVYYDNWSTDEFMKIPIGPLTSMPSTAITYKQSTGNSTTWDSTNWNYSTVERTPRVYLEYGKSWPSATLSPVDPISFEVKVGYGGSTAVPKRIKQAMYMLISHWYENREPYIVAQSIERVPETVDALLSDYRIWEFY